MMLLTQRSQSYRSYAKHQPMNHRIVLYDSVSEFDKDYSKYRNDDEDTDARSQFGTKSYWDAMYEGTS